MQQTCLRFPLEMWEGLKVEPAEGVQHLTRMPPGSEVMLYWEETLRLSHDTLAWECLTGCGGWGVRSLAPKSWTNKNNNNCFFKCKNGWMILYKDVD